jgi:predicted dehydrogenase
MSDQPMHRREFVRSVSAGSLGALLSGGLAANAVAAESAKAEKKWQPVSDRKIRVGIVGYGVCRFGAAFSFQDHPNVQVVAVSDLFADRREALAKACRCGKTYESLEVLVKDPAIEAVFVATDAASHARHCMEVLSHGKHVMCAVPAVLGSVEDAAQLAETVKKTGLKYMMAETSYFRPDCYAMRTIYRAGGLGRIVYSEGEYYHHTTTQIDSYKEWRVGLPPLWYPTHSTAYYVGVTGKRFTSVSCQGFRGAAPKYKPGGNKYNNPFADEIALFQTSEGGVSRMLMAHSINGLVVETGRVFGERGWFDATGYHGAEKNLPDTTRSPLPPGVAPGGHGGSHGYLAHEFVNAILDDRQPAVSIYEALAMTVSGIIAHQSALKDGETLKVPQFDPRV